MAYEFSREDAFRFAQFMGTKAIPKGNNLIFDKCPYCKGTTKDKNTFAISLSTGQFQCLRSSCGQRGNMKRLAKDFDFTINDMYEFQRSDDFMVWKQFPKPEPTELVYSYMSKRGISAEICRKYHITNHREQPTTITFPFYDEQDKLQCIKYRNTEYKKGDKGNKEWWQSAAEGKRNKMILFGMDQCNLDNKTLILTEGQIDSLSLAEAGLENAVSVPTGANGFTWFQHCYIWLRNFNKLIVFGDNENGHITLLDEMVARFEGNVYRIPDSKYYGHKDANEILTTEGKEKLIDAVNSAVKVPITAIKDLADVKHIDINDMERCETGINELNKVLGGFFFGQLILITGKRGEGKSTLASEFGTCTLKNNYPTLFYSGELSDWYFKMWMDRQVAGPSNVCNNHFDYYVPDEIMPQVDEFYREHGAMLFDNNAVGSDDFIGILDTMEIAIKRNGAKALFIDNLMTAMEDDMQSDIYRAQSNFTKKLALMAKKYNVLIFLICHPKKTMNRELDNDDIAGSGNIANLADVVLSYSLPPADKEGNIDTSLRLLRVLKNRLTGKLELNGIKLHYDEASKRIAGLGKKFDWELIKHTNDSGFIDLQLDDDRPF